jgi:hypothetical protein
MVAKEAGAWRLRLSPGGPRLCGADLPGDLPPLIDIFQTKDEAVAAAQKWNLLAHQKNKGGRRKCAPHN